MSRAALEAYALLRTTRLVLTGQLAMALAPVKVGLDRDDPPLNDPRLLERLLRAIVVTVENVTQQPLARRVILVEAVARSCHVRRFTLFGGSVATTRASRSTMLNADTVITTRQR